MSLLVNVVMTCFMTGLIWFVQIVHYPLFNRVAKSSFNDYHKMHVMFTGRVVIFPMLLELIAGFHLLYYNLNTQFLFLSIINVGILIGIWMSTFCFQVPAHNRLAIQFSTKDYYFLLKTNWIRTILWTLKSILLLYLVHAMLG